MFVYITIYFQIGGNRELCLGGVVEPGACLDLIIRDVPDGLPIPKIYKDKDHVPSWNELNGN